MLSCDVLDKVTVGVVRQMLAPSFARGSLVRLGVARPVAVRKSAIGLEVFRSVAVHFGCSFPPVMTTGTHP